MTRTRRTCRSCGRRVALTDDRRLWTHGRPECPGSRRRWVDTHYWPTRLYGRRVALVTGPDTWNPQGDA